MENYLTKKNIVIAVVVLVLVIGALVYFGRKPSAEGGGGNLFSGLFPGGGEEPASPSVTPTPEATPTPEIAQAGPLPISAEDAKKLPIGALIKLTDGPVSSIFPGTPGIVKYHKNSVENLGHLFERKIDATNQENRLSNFTLPQILKVVWSGGAADGKRAVVFYNIGDELRKLLVDYTDPKTPKTNFLPNSVSDIVFSPDGKSMAFINDLPASPSQGGGDTRNIFTATADFKNQKKVMDNEIPDLELSWPAASILAVKTKSSYAAPGFLYTVSVSSGAFTKIAEGPGLDAVWNSDGSGMLYSTSDSGGRIQSLKFYDLKSGKTQDTGLRTIAEKCAFLKTQKNLAVCAASKNGNLSLKYPDDWWKGKIAFQDDFFSVDMAVGEAKGFSQTSLDVVMPKPAPDDSFLLFQDKTTGTLWSVKLK